jgi:hypothetical protein
MTPSRDFRSVANIDAYIAGFRRGMTDARAGRTGLAVCVADADYRLGYRRGQATWQRTQQPRLDDRSGRAIGAQPR